MTDEPCDRDEDRESVPNEPDSIEIGIPISPAEYRELKERAKHGDEEEEGGD